MTRHNTSHHRWVSTYRRIFLAASLCFLPTASAGEVRDALPANGKRTGAASGASGVVRPESRNLTVAQVKKIFRDQIRNPKAFRMVTREKWGAAAPDPRRMDLMDHV